MTRVLAVADTDSYLKWSAATLAAMPDDWSRTQLVLANPAMPSAQQMVAATPHPVETVSARQLAARIRDGRPDVVLLACTGPVVATLTKDRLFRSDQRPVLVTGLPGISVPASRRAVTFRAACDLFLLHSHREVAEFRAVGRDLGVTVEFGLARLPFLNGPTGATVTPAPVGTDVVFAAQAKVPPEPRQRERILVGLARCGDGVVKLRATATEQQTHAEHWPYPELYRRLVAEGRLPRGALRFAAGSMTAALRKARGLVTVSSTAALEAMAAGVPLLVLKDFGFSDELINLVFAGSGCLGTLEDLAAGRFFVPDPGWLRANYFHTPDHDDWLPRLEQLLQRRVSTGLRPLRAATGSTRARVRRRLRLLVPAPAWPLLRRWRRLSLLVPAAAAGPGRTAPAPPPALRSGPASAVPPAGPPAGHRPRRPASRPSPSPPGH
jgi:hypothetical protein